MTNGDIAFLYFDALQWSNSGVGVYFRYVNTWFLIIDIHELRYSKLKKLLMFQVKVTKRFLSTGQPGVARDATSKKFKS